MNKEAMKYWHFLELLKNKPELKINCGINDTQTNKEILNFLYLDDEKQEIAAQYLINSPIPYIKALAIFIVGDENTEEWLANTVINQEEHILVRYVAGKQKNCPEWAQHMLFLTTDIAV